MDEVKDPNNADLQNLISQALHERKALLCLVFDGTESSKKWESHILDLRHHKKLNDTTLCAKMHSLSPQAQLLNAVCPIQSTPAVIIVQNGQVIGNYQKEQPSGRTFVEQIRKKYSLSEEEIESLSAAHENDPKLLEGTIQLPSPAGRMRLPSNAYEKFRKLTREYLAQGLSGKHVGQIQLGILRKIEDNGVESAVESLSSEKLESGACLTLPEELMNKLLNSPPSIINAQIFFVNTKELEEGEPRPELVVDEANHPDSIPSQTTTAAVNVSSRVAPSRSARSPIESVSPHRPQDTPGNNVQDAASLPNERPPQDSATARTSKDTQSSSSAQAAQRSDYVRQQRERETAQKAERERIKAQISADRAARREAEANRKIEERQTDLESMRKANSTTANPRSSDIRVQVRTFDGGTIKTTFARSATISRNVRPWIDQNRETKEPYDLKLILMPLPNRNIEAGEEEQELSDLGIKGSCTMVMVPVKGFVESYTNNTSGSLLGSAVSGGYGLVSGAAGLLYGGVRSLLAGGGAGSTTPASAPQSGNGQPQSSPSTGGNSANVKVRTLADQRIEDSKKRGNQLYNGNQLNFEPRKDEDNENQKRD